MRRDPRCEICEQKPAQSVSESAPHGWCSQCEVEFQEFRQRVAATCDAGCPTPISCRIMKQCAHRAESVTV